MTPVDQDDFERLVGDALDELPEQLGRLLDNVVLVVEDQHPEEELYGLYEGVPLTERHDYGDFSLPDRITLYRLPLCRDSEDTETLRQEVLVTVVHEVAHHFGIDDASLHQLGWG